MLSPMKRLVATAALVGTAGVLAVPSSPIEARGGSWFRPPPKLSVSDASASEGDGAIEFEVTLDRAARWPVVATLLTSNGTAKRSSDFIDRWVAVRIPAGQTSATASVRLVDDDVAEPDETFRIRAAAVWGARKGDAKAIGTIVDDALTVNLLHMNDHHSNLQPRSARVDLGTSGGRFDYRLGGFPRVVSKFAELEAANDNVVKIHAGDAITGTLFYTLFKGQADAELMNEVCFDVFALGNHEFDDSDAGLKQFLDWLNEGECDTATLGANVIPQVGTPLAPTTVNDYIQPYVIKQFGPEQVGFIGIDIAQKTQVSSSPLPTTQFLDEVETAQRYVNELAEMGIDNIVLVTHYGYQNDLALAAQVTGIDAIVGGDSHTLLGDFGAFGLTGEGPYPTMATNADGDPVCVVQAWQYSAVVGQLAVSFDQGRTVGCDGTPHLITSDYSRGGAPIDPTELAEIEAIVDGIASVSIVEPDADAQAILDEYAAQVDVLSEQVIGAATEPLCLNRQPGDSRGAPLCTPDQVAASGARSDVNGGFIQQIVTDAFKARSFRSDIALQNAGGVRINIPAGDVTIGDAFTLLPFANTLVEIELSGAEVATVLEEAVANFLDNGGSNGSYPYGSAIRWDVDLSQPAGSRFSNIEVRDAGGVWGPIDPAATYVVVTNSFLAAGRDGWLTFGVATSEGRTVDTFIDYAQGFVDWVEQDAAGVITVPAPTEFSTQSYIPPAP